MTTDDQARLREETTARERLTEVQVPGTIPADGQPTAERELDDTVCLRTVKVRSFTARPSTVPPSGTTTLRWDVNVPPGCQNRLTFSLNGRRVDPSGTMRVRPSTTTTYRLTAGTGGPSAGSTTLSSIEVRTDDSDCETVPFPESDVRSDVREVVHEELGKDTRVSERSATEVSIDPDGLHIALRLTVAVKGLKDPGVDIDLTLGARMRAGDAEMSYRNFERTVKWSKWTKIKSAGAYRIANWRIKRKIDNTLKPKILNAATTRLDERLDQVPGDWSPASIAFDDGAIILQICPATD